jgi:hypothetical protein
MLPVEDGIFTYVAHSDRDLLCILLDIITFNSKVLDKQSLSCAYYALETTYVEFAKRATKFQHVKMVKQWHEVRVKVLQMQQAEVDKEKASITTNIAKNVSNVPLAELPKKNVEASDLSLVSGFTLGEFDDNYDVWEFLDDGVDVAEDGGEDSVELAMPEADP